MALSMDPETGERNTLRASAAWSGPTCEDLAAATIGENGVRLYPIVKGPADSLPLSHAHRDNTRRADVPVGIKGFGLQSVGFVASCRRDGPRAAIRRRDIGTGELPTN